MRAVLPLTNAGYGDERALMFTQVERSPDESDSVERVLPYNPYGLIFLRRIKIVSTVPRMRADGPQMSSSAFLFFFGKSEREIRDEYNRVVFLAKGAINRKRIPNKAKITKRYELPADEPEVPIFDLASLGHALPPPAVDSGSDVDDSDDPDVGEIDREVSAIWRQFLVDMKQKAPNPRQHGAPSYLKLNVAERRRASEEVFRNVNLSEIWTCIWYKVAERSDFDKSFRYLFPVSAPEVAPSTQNYKQAKYFNMWMRILNESEEETIEVIRNHLRRRFDTLTWVPYAISDRIWTTHPRRPVGFTRLPVGSRGPAPRILIRVRPSW
jgi:hypothetical protein